MFKSISSLSYNDPTIDKQYAQKKKKRSEDVLYNACVIDQRGVHATTK